MNLSELARALHLDDLTPELAGDEAAAVEQGYVSDLLSDVLAYAPPGGLLVTGQIHLNVVAVAVNAGLAGVVFPMNRRPEDNVRARAVEEGVRLYRTPMSAFELVGRMHQLGLRGPNA